MSELLKQENVILDHRQIKQKLKRMAYEIYEQNPTAEEIVLAGIHGMGERMAQMLSELLQAISGKTISLITVTVDKKAPLQSEVVLSAPTETLVDKPVVLVDDVLNTGRTLAYSLKCFLQVRISRLQVAVLVDRGYHDFPIAADFIGYELSTTISEHIEADLRNKDNMAIYLY